MGQINKYASTRCPLFGQTTPLGLAPIERFDAFAPIYLSVGTSTTPISGEEHALDVDYAGLCSSGDSMVGLDVSVTPAGSAATWVSGIFAKVNQTSTKAVSGYLCAAELEINLGGSYNPSDWAVLVLNSNDDNTGSNSNNAVILVRDYGNREPANFVRLYDTTPGSGSPTALFTAETSGTLSHLLRIMVGTTPYWIMVTDDVPS